MDAFPVAEAAAVAAVAKLTITTGSAIRPAPILAMAAETGMVPGPVLVELVVLASVRLAVASVRAVADVPTAVRLDQRPDAERPCQRWAAESACTVEGALRFLYPAEHSIRHGWEWVVSCEVFAMASCQHAVRATRLAPRITAAAVPVA